MTLDVHFFLTIVSILVAIPMLFYAGLLSMWFLGAPPFHRAYKEEGTIPVAAVPIPIGSCPKCGYQSKEFMAFVQKLQREEMHGS